MTKRMVTLARPYALAAFEYAQEHKALSAWRAMLTAAAYVAQDPAVAQLLKLPEMTSEQMAKFFCEVLASILDQPKLNFIQLLAEKSRLPLLPDIADVYKELQEAFEKTLDVNVITATTLDDAMQDKVAAALKQRLKKKINLQCKLDPTILGGAIVRTVDMVIDGSVQGQLKRLLDSLSV